MPNVSILKETFYRLFFTDYCDFVRNVQMSINTVYDKNEGKFVNHDNLYIRAFRNYNDLLPSDSGDKINTENLKKRNFSDEHLMYSVDCFFDLIADDEATVAYVNGLMTFVRDGGTEDQDRLLNIEEQILRIILHHFWNEPKMVNAKLELQDKDTKLISKLTFEEFFDGLNKKKYNYHDVIMMLGQLLGGPGNSYYSVVKYLFELKKLRNKEAHQRLEKEYNVIDARARNRFRFYTFFTTILYLQAKNNITGGNHNVFLHVQCSTQENTKNFSVKLTDKNKNDVHGEPENRGWKYKISPYQSYTLIIEGCEPKPIYPEWHWLAPLAVYDGAGIKCFPNDFEASPQARIATFHTVMELNEKTKDTLEVVLANIERIAANTDELKKISDNSQLLVERFSQLVMVMLEKPKEPSAWEEPLTIIDKLKNAVKEEGAKTRGTVKEEGAKTRGTVEEESKKIRDAIKKYVRTFVVVVAAVAAAVLIALYLYSEHITDTSISHLTPEKLIVQGDQYQRNGEFDKAGEAYRQAIQCYKDTLSKDSNNVKANLGLAMMLMRGKGGFDLNMAKQCVWRVVSDTTQSRAEGLYVYLLIRNNMEDEACKWLQQKMYKVKDDYARLAEALLTLKGYFGQQTEVSARDIFKSMLNINNQEALLEMSALWMEGLKNKRDMYLIWPRPIFSFIHLNILANDSLSPIARGMLSDFYANIGESVQALDATYIALACGLNEAAPVMRLRMLNYIDLEKSSEEVRKVFEKVSKLTSKHNSLVSAVSDYTQEVFKYNNDKGKISLSQLISDTDTLIAKLENEHSEEYSIALDDLCHKRISLCLENNDIDRAVALAVELDGCNDSVAVRNYLLGVCYAQGYGHFTKDIEKSDSLIKLSADKGYVEALYTQIRRHDRVGNWLIETDTIDRGISNNIKQRKKSAVFKPNGTTSQPVLANLEKQTDFDDLPPEFVVREVRSTYTYLVSQYAEVPDSVWKKSPRIAMALDNYWFPYYNKKRQHSPFLESCPKEYQIMCRVIDKTFDIDEESQICKIKDLHQLNVLDYIEQLEIGFAEALKNGRGLMARHLLTLRVILSRHFNIDTNTIDGYEFFTLPDYRQHFKLFMNIEGPVYAY